MFSKFRSGAANAAATTAATVVSSEATPCVGANTVNAPAVIPSTYSASCIGAAGAGIECNPIYAYYDIGK